MKERDDVGRDAKAYIDKALQLRRELGYERKISGAAYKEAVGRATDAFGTLKSQIGRTRK